MPDIGPGQVRVRVRSCGVCLTDVHRIEGYFGPPDPPRILGHEYGGQIEAVGNGVDGLEAGMTVACWGAQGFAEYSVVPADRAYPIPPDQSLDHAAFTEPIACCVAAVENARLHVGSLVLIAGAGPMGLLTLQLARRGGAARILVSEPNPTRRALALRLGADRAVDPRAESLAEAVASFTRGDGVDAAFDAAGHPDPLGQCLESVAEGGHVVMVGVPPTTAHLDLPLYRFHRRNLTLTGSYGAIRAGAVRAAVNWLGQLDLDALVSHRFPLVEIASAFEIARAGAGLKVLVEL
ncbi:MAG: zinc-dependent alcohol dehydrogenase [Chloroflexota bacterium]